MSEPTELSPTDRRHRAEAIIASLSDLTAFEIYLVLVSAAWHVSEVVSQGDEARTLDILEAHGRTILESVQACRAMLQSASSPEPKAN